MRGETFSCARVLLETKLIESITGSVVIVCEGHCYEVDVRVVPVCPSAPCSFANSLETAVMVDFLAVDGGGDRWKCNGPMDLQEGHRSSQL